MIISPVILVDLKQPHVVVAFAGPAVDGVGVADALVENDALAVGLVPRVFGAPLAHRHHVRRGAAVAAAPAAEGTVSAALASRWVGDNHHRRGGSGRRRDGRRRDERRRDGRRSHGHGSHGHGGGRGGRCGGGPRGGCGGWLNLN